MCIAKGRELEVFLREGEGSLGVKLVETILRVVENPVGSRYCCFSRSDRMADRQWRGEDDGY